MDKKIKISIIGIRGYPYVYSGYETFVKELSERLVKKGCDVTVYCHKGLFIERPKKLNGINLKYIPTIETKVLSQFIHSFFSIIHSCFSNNDVILVVNSANGPFGLITKVFRKSTVINVDGLEWLRPKWKGLGSIYFKWASKMATIFYDQIINDSDEMRKIYLNLFKTDSKVIAYGADIRKSSYSELINNWDIKKGEYYLVVGRLIPDNNADFIIKGFLASSSNKKLVIVGDVPYKDKYANNLKSINDERLIFTGYVNDQNILAELYHNSYVYIHGHEFGGTNPTMIKAMAYGSAILALNTRFNNEMLQDGKYGLFFKKEIKEITYMINYCEKENILIEKLRDKSVSGITEKYDWDFITNRYLDVFRSLILKRN
ncbi:MAG: glycosyltransferase [Flavobacteriaceae bacterium]